MVYTALPRPARKKTDSYRWNDPEGRRIVKIEHGGKETRLSFDEKLEPNFGDFVARQLDGLFSQFKAAAPEPGLRERTPLIKTLHCRAYAVYNVALAQAHCSQQRGVVFNGRPKMWVLVPCPATKLSENLQMSAAEGFRFPQPVRRAKQHREVVEI
jgi:hypothetical protein